MSAPQTVLELIERFDRNCTAYKSDQYNEARLRIEFLNPFFEALGWDVYGGTKSQDNFDPKIR